MKTKGRGYHSHAMGRAQTKQTVAYQPTKSIPTISCKHLLLFLLEEFICMFPRRTLLTVSTCPGCPSSCLKMPRKVMIRLFILKTGAASKSCNMGFSSYKSWEGKQSSASVSHSVLGLSTQTAGQGDH